MSRQNLAKHQLSPPCTDEMTFFRQSTYHGGSRLLLHFRGLFGQIVETSPHCELGSRRIVALLIIKDNGPIQYADERWFSGESFVNDSRAVFPRQKVTESQSHQDVKYRMSYSFGVKVNFDPLDFKGIFSYVFQSTDIILSC